MYRSPVHNYSYYSQHKEEIYKKSTDTITQASILTMTSDMSGSSEESDVEETLYVF